MTDDTFQLRSPSHYITISKEGFNLFREHYNTDSQLWNEYLRENKIVPIARQDTNWFREEYSGPESQS